MCYSSVLAWMSAMVSLNELRAGPRFKKGMEAAEGTCSDGTISLTSHLHVSVGFTAHMIV